MSEESYDFLRLALEKRRAEGLERHLSLAEEGSIDFYSNDFLGLAQTRHDLHQPSGSSGSRLISGNSIQAEELEQQLAKDYHAPQALLFSSGYACNLGVISVLPQKGDVVLYDAHVHASIKEAFRLSLAQFFSYRHNDFDHLETQLKKHKDKRCWIVTESVFSMHGTVINPKQINTLKDRYKALLIVDEAHAVGVVGLHNLGNFSVDKRTIKVVTFGKGYGAQGAAVLCDEVVRQYLVNFSRPFIYTTGMSPVLIELIHRQHKRLIDSHSQREQLNNNIRYFRTKILQKNIKVGSGQSPIQMWYPRHQNWERIREKLREAKIAAKVILPPTVRQGDEGVRIILHSFNTHEEIDRLLHVMVECNQR